MDLSEYGGRQKLLAVWNIGHTVNAFYSCVDLQIGSGGGGTPTTTKPPVTTTTTPPTKPPTTAPLATTTTVPTTTHSHQPPLSTTHSHQPPATTTAQPSAGAWTVGEHYTVGDIVTYNGKRYRCLQAHTVYDPGWTPTAAPALWQAL